MAPVNGSIIQGSFLHGLPRPALHGPAARGAAPSPPIQRMANGSAVQVPVSPGFFGTGMGQRLPETIQRKMESLFGTRFDDVRIHVGPQATSLGALAFTYGSNIYFAHGQYNPQTAQGQRLLGHELTHVVQQRSGRARNPFGSGVAVLQDPALEAEAERMGLRAAAPEMGRMPAPPPSAIQRKPVVGAAPRVLQSRILPVPPPGRRGVLQMVHEEGLQALSMLFKASERSQGNKSSAGEIQAMYIDSNVVVALNSDVDLRQFLQSFPKKKATAIDFRSRARTMHAEASARDRHENLSDSYDFLFGTVSDSRLTGQGRATEALDFVTGNLGIEDDRSPFYGIHTVDFAGSAQSCASKLGGGVGKIIILESDRRHHAEQQLLEVLACRLQQGHVPEDLGIRGVRKPCTNCHAVLKAFDRAYGEVYRKSLTILPAGEGTTGVTRLDLKEKFPNEDGEFGRFIEIYDELLNAGRYELNLSATSTVTAARKIEGHLGERFDEAKELLLAGYNSNQTGVFTLRRSGCSPSIEFTGRPQEKKDLPLSQLLTHFRISHEPPPKVEESRVEQRVGTYRQNGGRSQKGKKTSTTPTTPIRRPETGARQGQKNSWGWGTWLTLAGVGFTAVYGVASMLMKEDPSRPQPSLPLPPGRRSPS